MTRQRKYSRRRRRGANGEAGGLIDRIWSLATDVRTAGSSLVLSGVVLAVTPWTRAPDPLVTSWWESAVYLPDVIGMAAGFAGLAVVLLVGAFWNRYQVATDSAAAGQATADLTVADGGESDHHSSPPWIAWCAMACMVSGLGLVVGDWFVAQQQVGAARVSIAVGETIDHYTVPYGKDELEIMLPLRVRLSSLASDDHPRADLQAFQAGQTPPKPQTLPAGSGLKLEDYRLTFVGMKPDAASLQAIFEADAPDTISAAAGKGDTFQLSVDGPEYKVLEIARNRGGRLGQAAKIRSPDFGEFWVYRETPSESAAPRLGHPVRLRGLRTQPAAVFTVAKAAPFWPISMGGTIFVVGFALLIVFPERISRVSDGQRNLWSFNEAGPVAEEFLLSPPDPNQSAGRQPRGPS